jgi:hypothetical protein
VTPEVGELAGSGFNRVSPSFVKLKYRLAIEVYLPRTSPLIGRPRDDPT